MNRKPVALLVCFCVAALCGPAALRAQDAPAAVQDPISPADCLKDKKKAPDCQRLGILYGEGREVPLDEPRAIGFLDAACRADLVTSCSVQGWLLLKLHQRPEDVKRGEELLDHACKQNAALACGLLGRAYAEGIGVAKDARKAGAPLEKACDAGSAQACSALAGLPSVSDGNRADAARAEARMRRACSIGPQALCQQVCDAGDGNACVVLGDLLIHAKEPDTGRALRVYERACNATVALGCYRLGLRVEDKEQAVALFERACSLEHGPGCLAAGQRYQLGSGVTADLGKAASLYSRACASEVSAACRFLGGMYARGELGSDGIGKAQDYLVKACGEEVECRAIVANGRVPSAWGGSLQAVRPSEASARPDQPVRVGGSIQEPRKIKNVNPVYPPAARAARAQGMVALECEISPEGDVTILRVVRSIPLLDLAAMEAVRQWRYAPTLVDGQPVSVITTLTVDFWINWGRPF